MSAHVVHLVRGASSQDAYWSIIGILSSGRLVAQNSFGIAKSSAPVAASQRAVCFSEAPVEMLDRIARRRVPEGPRGWHGIGFTKEFMVERGGGPILYAYDGSPQSDAIRSMMRMALASPQPDKHPIWQLTPFIDSPGPYGGGAYFFEWEREWRHQGDLVFSPEDVAFLIMPEDYHEAARGFFEGAYYENTGPAYFCPYLDINWSRDRCLQELRRGSRPPGRR
jgi:hypothetical protein